MQVFFLHFKTHILKYRSFIECAYQKIIAYHFLIKSCSRDGYINMKNISEILTVWSIVILHVRRLQLIGSRQNTRYCYLYKHSQRYC